MRVLNKEEIEKIIPHRGRALLVDEVILDDDGMGGCGYLMVREEHCEGHFPGNPILRGVDRVEMAAITMAVIVLAAEKGEVLPLFDSCSGITFTGMVRPGDELKAVVKIHSLDSKRMSGSAVLTVSNKVVGSFDHVTGVKVGKRVLERMRR